ncbi:L-threonylcarbamoyladenylate synthase [Kaarinaea lacus]
MTRWQLTQATRVIRQGGIIAYPTEAVYGLGCDPYNAEAVMRLLALKRRPAEKGLILIASDISQLAPFMAPLSTGQLEQLGASWPGPVTWLVPARPETPGWLRGSHDTIAVRVTDHPVASALCQTAGHALVSTSANPAGRYPATTPLQVRRYFCQRENQVDYIVHGPLGNQVRPTTIRDLQTGKTVRPA